MGNLNEEIQGLYIPTEDLKDAYDIPIEVLDDAIGEDLINALKKGEFPQLVQKIFKDVTQTNGSLSSMKSAELKKKVQQMMTIVYYMAFSRGIKSISDEIKKTTEELISFPDDK